MDSILYWFWLWLAGRWYKSRVTGINKNSGITEVLIFSCDPLDPKGFEELMDKVENVNETSQEEP